VKTEFELTVRYLPKDFEAIGSETEDDDSGGKYYKQIRSSNEKSSVEFVLIPRKKQFWKADANLADPRTFYISRFKTSREQFRMFAVRNPEKVTDERWREGDRAKDDHVPVRNVTVTDAHAFAEWLGGRLPSCKQWDKATGRYHPSRRDREGPYKGKWDGKKSLKIAVGELSNPLPNGSPETEDDVSVYGCRDMAGNGSEWTRTMLIAKKEVSLDKDFGMNPVILRGWSFREHKPLSFSQLDREDDQSRVVPSARYTMTSYEDPGFRVVLEPNR
jgi:formylglycine-generating enzyme required for sulfatase activity